MDDHSRAYYAVLLTLADRYAEMASDQDEIFVNFIEEFRSGILSNQPLLKLNRWLGYIQGILIERGKTTVTIERDYTRPYFRPLDFP